MDDVGKMLVFLENWCLDFGNGLVYGIYEWGGGG